MKSSKLLQFVEAGKVMDVLTGKDLKVCQEVIPVESIIHKGEMDYVTMLSYYLIIKHQGKSIVLLYLDEDPRTNSGISLYAGIDMSDCGILSDTAELFVKKYRDPENPCFLDDSKTADLPVKGIWVY